MEKTDGRTQRILFTVKSLEKLPVPNEGRATVYDERERGLAIRIDASGRKEFLLVPVVGGLPVFRALGTFPRQHR